MAFRILVLQGPNMNRLGRRPQQYYGSQTLAELQSFIDERAKTLGVQVEHFQSNTEGTIIDWLQERQDTADAIIINPAGLSFNGDALRFAIQESNLPLAVVHLSNVFAREDVRNTFGPERFADISRYYNAGFGRHGYLAALEALVRDLNSKEKSARANS